MDDSFTSRIAVDVNSGDERWQAGESFFLKAAAAVAAECPMPQPCQISFLLTDDEGIRELNGTYRGKPVPTNVLSFPVPAEVLTEPGMLGDVVLSFDTLQREAGERPGLTFEAHLTHLSVHGILHLLGYDHETQEEAEVMEALEIKILKNLSIENPYRDIQHA